MASCLDGHIALYLVMLATLASSAVQTVCSSGFCCFFGKYHLLITLRRRRPRFHQSITLFCCRMRFDLEAEVISRPGFGVSHINSSIDFPFVYFTIKENPQA